MNKNIKITLLSLFSVFLILCFLYFSPFLEIKNINVVGLENLTKEAIISKINLQKNKKNLLFFNTLKAKSKLSSEPYIKSVKLNKIFPNSLDIILQEKKIRGFIPYLENYLYIDSEGTILNIQNDYKKGAPIIIGLKFQTFAIGELLKVENPEVFRTIVDLSNLMQKYELIEDILKIDVSDIKNIRLFVKNIEVVLGSFEDLNWKISTLKEIIQHISDDDKGFLYLNDPNQSPRFSYLT